LIQKTKDVLSSWFYLKKRKTFKDGSPKKAQFQSASRWLIKFTVFAITDLLGKLEMICSIMVFSKPTSKSSHELHPPEFWTIYHNISIKSRKKFVFTGHQIQKIHFFQTKPAFFDCKKPAPNLS